MKRFVKHKILISLTGKKTSWLFELTLFLGDDSGIFRGSAKICIKTFISADIFNMRIYFLFRLDPHFLHLQVFQENNLNFTDKCTFDIFDLIEDIFDPW